MIQMVFFENLLKPWLMKDKNWVEQLAGDILRYLTLNLIKFD